VPFADIGGVVHHYLVEGQDRAPALVFSNSLGTDLHIWDALIPPLLNHFRIVRYDKRGHGLSDVREPPYSIDDLAQDLVGLLEALSISEAVVCGISVGGLIAQRLASIHPHRVRALVLCDTGARIGSLASWEERIAAVKSSGLKVLAGPSMERWFTQAYRESCPTDVRGYSNMLLRTSVDGYIGACCVLRNADLTSEASRIKQPTLVLGGDQDVTTPPELGRQLARLIPRADFSLIQRAAHLPCIEQPKDVVERMMRFFREVQIV
jgi:3-oxoadipate enol-lactonase